MGRARLCEDGGFPLLVKILDARTDLSLQVHPDRAYAKSHPGVRPKDEAWFILRAPVGASIIRGIDPSLSREAFGTLLREGRAADGIVRVPVRGGDCLLLPGGICHALCGGIMAVEVQTPSDTTFRLWDWDRRDPSRPLQVQQALECLLTGAAQGLDRPITANSRATPGIEAAGFRTVRLCRCESFEMESIAVIAPGGASLPVVTDGQPVIWVMVEGGTEFDLGDGTPPLRVDALTTVLLPAASEGMHARLDAGSSLLRITLADRMGRMLAIQP